MASLKQKHMIDAVKLLVDSFFLLA